MVQIILHRLMIINMNYLIILLNNYLHLLNLIIKQLLFMHITLVHLMGSSY
jgi:hypothetical protein